MTEKQGASRMRGLAEDAILGLRGKAAKDYWFKGTLKT
jgi:hypothetical protein